MSSGQPFIQYRSGYRFQLAEPYSIQTDLRMLTGVPPPTFLSLDDGGLLTIPAGYAWDGASFPLVWRLRSLLRASLVHDALYQLMRLGAMSIECKPVADLLLRDIAIEDGAGRVLTGAVYFARRWMLPATRPSAERVVLRAP